MKNNFKDIINDIENDIEKGKIRKINFIPDGLKRLVLTREKFNICVNGVTVLYFLKRQICGQIYVIYGDYDGKNIFSLTKIDDINEYYLVLEYIWSIAKKHEKRADDCIGHSNDRYDWYIN